MSNTVSSRPSPPGFPASPKVQIADAGGIAGSHPQGAGQELGIASTGAAGGMKTIAVVLTSTRRVVVGQHTYHVPPGQVIRLLTIPEGLPFIDGADTRNVPAGALKLGDQVGEDPTQR